MSQLNLSATGSRYGTGNNGEKHHIRTETRNVMRLNSDCMKFLFISHPSDNKENT